MTFTQLATKVGPDGAAVLETLVPRADITISIADKKARFAYLNGALHWYLNGQEQTPPKADLSKAPLFSSPMLVTMKPDGTVTDVSFADAQIMEALRKLIPNLGSGLPTQTSLPMFPAKPVQVGESWTQSGSLPLPSGQTGSFNSRRTLASLDTQGGFTVAKITGFSQVKFSCASQTVPGPGGQKLSFSIPEMKESVTSTEFFNASAGLPMRGDYDLQFNMNMSAGLGTTTQAGSMDLRLRATMVVTRAGSK